jgi:hypothetical protein
MTTIVKPIKLTTPIMSRIKNKGLEYFPLDTRFVASPIVRRIAKLCGDSSLSVLLHIFSRIYADEGYYAAIDEYFYEDIASMLFEKDADYVKTIVELSVRNGLFDKRLFAEAGILTSEEIQKQFVFSTKRRTESNTINETYNLIPKDKKDNISEKSSVPTVTEMPKNVTQSTHSIAQHSTAKHSTKTSSSKVPPATPQEEGGTEEDFTSRESKYREKIDALSPPDDGVQRNFDGLKESLNLFHIPADEQYTIICRSNFGQIGHPMWRGFATLRSAKNGIHLPGRYLLSLCK